MGLWSLKVKYTLHYVFNSVCNYSSSYTFVGLVKFKWVKIGKILLSTPSIPLWYPSHSCRRTFYTDLIISELNHIPIDKPLITLHLCELNHSHVNLWYKFLHWAYPSRLYNLNHTFRNRLLNTNIKSEFNIKLKYIISTP